jgi:hypothetical protein
MFRWGTAYGATIRSVYVRTALGVATKKVESIVVVVAAHRDKMTEIYMLRPNPEFVQFWNWMDGDPIPIQNFQFGMGSSPIPNWKVSQNGIGF